MARPIIKWAGGKTQLLDKIRDMMPKEYNKYYEPFFGGGALFFNVQPKDAVINDLNTELVNLYNIVKNSPDELITELSNLQAEHNEQFYYEIREDFNQRINNKSKLGLLDAAEFIYLNKMGFNGLYRVNSKGLFNVPSGHKNKCNIVDKQNILEVSKILQNVNICNLDFEAVCKDAKRGDFIFFDSPYYDTFDTYQNGGFSEKDHIRLFELFNDLSNRGVYCLMTNSNTEFIKKLYKNFNIEIVDVKRMINSDGNNRVGKEVIITNY